MTEPWAVDPRYTSVDPVTERMMWCFACQYALGDELWEFRLWAYDFDDAERRVKALRGNAKLLGQVMKDTLNEV